MTRARELMNAKNSDQVTLTVVWDSSFAKEIVHELRGVPVNAAQPSPVGADETQPVTVQLWYPSREIQEVSADNLQHFLVRGGISFFERTSDLQLRFVSRPSDPLHVYKALEVMRFMCEFDSSPFARMTEAEVSAGIQQWRESPDYRIRIEPRSPPTVLQVELAHPYAYFEGSQFQVFLTDVFEEPTVTIFFETRDGIRWNLRKRNGHPHLLYFFTEVLPELNSL
jgi:hypothetical protein